MAGEFLQSYLRSEGFTDQLEYPEDISNKNQNFSQIFINDSTTTNTSAIRLYASR